MALPRLTIFAVGLATKVVFQLRLCNVSVAGLDILLRAQHNGPVITVSNHISTLDDPLAWGILPLANHLCLRKTRWTLGASDILFTNPLFATFFSWGQTLETFRGKGVYQTSIDIAIRKIRQGYWTHFFPEGKVNQPVTNPYYQNPTTHSLPRFKWGVGRVILDTLPSRPSIIPVFLTGFDQLMPEGRVAPWKFVPRFGQSLTVTFGQPLEHASLLDIAGSELRGPQLESYAALWHRAKAASPPTPESSCRPGATKQLIELETEARLAESVRSSITQLVQSKVEELGQKVLRSQNSSHTLPIP